MAKYKYEYRCPNCGTQLELKMRVTQTKRKCPHCGTLITPQEIDRQAAAKRKRELMGCLGLLGFVVILAVCSGILKALGFKRRAEQLSWPTDLIENENPGSG